MHILIIIILSLTVAAFVVFLVTKNKGGKEEKKLYYIMYTQPPFANWYASYGDMNKPQMLSLSQQPCSFKILPSGKIQTPDEKWDFVYGTIKVMPTAAGSSNDYIISTNNGARLDSKLGYGCLGVPGDGNPPLVGMKGSLPICNSFKVVSAN